MAECEIPLPCVSAVSVGDTAFQITNTGSAIAGTSAKDDNTAIGNGVTGNAQRGCGVQGNSSRSVGVCGSGGLYGVTGSSFTGTAAYFQIGNENNPNTALRAETRGKGSAIEATIITTAGGTPRENDQPALHASTDSSGEAIKAVTTGTSRAGEFRIRNPDNTRPALLAATNGNGEAVFALSVNGIGVLGIGPRLFAGKFIGDLDVEGNVFADSKTFIIDHPLDPANKYLIHSNIESSEMMNVYSGNTVLDQNGEAYVELGDWFEALNCDFRYQLTCIGGYAAVYIAEEVKGNRFKIAGGRDGMKVSWQLTGVRKDPWAQTHPLMVEKEKPANEKGYYRHPELYGQAPENGIYWANNPEKMQNLREQQQHS